MGVQHSLPSQNCFAEGYLIQAVSWEVFFMFTVSKLVSKVALVSVLATVGTQSVAFAENPPLEILSQTFQGNGCDASDFADIVDGNLDIFHSGLTAVTSATQALVKKLCVGKFQIQAPAGYKIAPVKVTADGFAKISPTGRGFATARFFKAGISAPPGVQELFPGSNVIQVESLDASLNPENYSQCGGVLNLRTQAEALAERGAHDAEQSIVDIGHAAGSLKAVSYKLSCIPCH
jgi:hypothetical protein